MSAKEKLVQYFGDHYTFNKKWNPSSNSETSDSTIFDTLDSSSIIDCFDSLPLHVQVCFVVDRNWLILVQSIDLLYKSGWRYFCKEQANVCEID